MSDRVRERRRMGAPDVPQAAPPARWRPAREGPDRRRTGRWLGLGLLGAAAVAGAGYVTYRYALRAPRRQEAGAEGGLRARAAVTVLRPREEVWAAWRDLERLPSNLRHLESVEARPDGRSRWTLRGPAGRDLSWEAEITDERENEHLVWRSVGETPVPNEGSVTFRDHPLGGTEVRVALHYQPPAGALGRAVSALLGKDPSRQLRGDLRRFQQRMETGVVLTRAHSQPSAR